MESVSSYTFKLEKIELVDFVFHKKQKDISLDIFHYDMKVENRFIPEKAIHIQLVNVKIFDKSRVHELASISVAIAYVISNFEKVFSVDRENGTFKVPIDLELYLRSISISTTRGVLFSKLMGTYLGSAVMPVVILNPIVLPEDEKVVRYKKKLEKKIKGN